MATGACGINCDVCRLNRDGVCSTCGPACGDLALKKIGAQKRLLGQACPVLECARINGVDYCLRDCAQFPCENFSQGPYPFSEGYLRMQQRRREENSPSKIFEEPVPVPAAHWEEFLARDPELLGEFTMAESHSPGEAVVQVMAEKIRIDGHGRRMWKTDGRAREEVRDPLTVLMILVYLTRATAFRTTGNMVGVQELKDAHFFQGPHDLNTGPLLKRFGGDAAAFQRAAEALGGQSQELADISYTIHPFPKIPLHYLLWEGDEEFGPHLSILFDRSIEQHFDADAIWGTVQMVSKALLDAADKS
jgi:hypothetical protein